jgi:peptidoglycan/xylan/chitin deacetylase (PgdA/CDA1 family)
MEPGALVVSLDFELYWGLLDQVPLEQCKTRLENARRVIPMLLGLFQDYGLHATWATVGFLFFSTREEMERGLPTLRPAYTDPHLCPYAHLASVGENETEDPYHFAGSLIPKLRDFPHQEVGTHTFCHYYCLEQGQDIEMFRADVAAARAAGKRHGIDVRSFVFPRNQLDQTYLRVLRESGMRAYRGRPPAWFVPRVQEADPPLLNRVLRTLDCYLPISRSASYPRQELGALAPYNVRASRFLRPYSRRLRALEFLRLRRVAGEMTTAARRGEVYHLWWHPENFGTDTEANLAGLRHLLDHFRRLQARWGMESLNMGEMAARAEAQASPVDTPTLRPT